MKESDSFIEGDKNNLNESINIPTFSFSSTIKCKKKKIKSNNKKNDKEDYEELSIIKRLNNNNENINGITDNEDYPIETLNKIMTFNKNLLMEEDKKMEKIEIKFGRKKKNSSEEGKHNKYSGDNLVRKCKGVILHNLYILINNIITENYENEKGYDKKRIKLLKINQNQIINSDVKFNKEFLHKQLKDIFSEKVSQRCSTYCSDHNKILINALLNEENTEKRELFTKIFNLTFLDCLEHFRGTKYIKELNNLIKYDDICKIFEDDEDYLYSFKFYIENFEKIIDKKRERKKKEKKLKEIVIG